MQISQVDTLNINSLNRKVIPEQIKQQWKERQLTPEKLVQELFKSNKLVFLGEVPHANEDAVDFTVNNMEILSKQRGVKTIYVELIDTRHQPTVDLYLNEKNEKKANELFEKIKKEANYGMGSKLAVLKKARELRKQGVDINVITFYSASGELYFDDVKKVYPGPWYSEAYKNEIDFELMEIVGRTRVIPSNNHWERVIAKNMEKNEGKGIILGGGGHGLFPGYGNIAGAPVVLFSSPKYKDANRIIKYVGITSDFEVRSKD
ncbi:MAG: hypothetical protein SFU25_08065 [Candidatus Caenarcaniphilales bacterium]|nr:hypothetical protein [Candidatus Caenarcaniphilales bacterium]